jgi:hypothetical protein
MTAIVGFYAKKGRDFSRPFLLQGTEPDSIEVAWVAMTRFWQDIL